jgi:hypothetical protein
MQLATDWAATAQARAITMYKINELSTWIEGQLEYIRDAHLEAHYAHALSQISNFLENPEKYEHETPLDIPPGQPIGDCGMIYLNQDGLPY